jgi:DNA helicase-2/ATP-dependent DNA helicase PcrA
MLDFTFTESQQQLITTPGSLFASACPGAGKTEAVVQRFIDRPGVSGRRGVALLSFTRAATDEARSRCRDHPALMECPNFVGTIDSFINRFIVGPVFRAQIGIVPTFKDNWSNVHGASFTLNVQAAAGIQFQLDWYQFGEDGSAELLPMRMPWDVRRRIEAAQWLVPRSETVAAGRWRRLVETGIIDCAHARSLSRGYIADPCLAERLGSLLRNRFFEVIVDEVQDCNPVDILVLRFLLDAGVNVVMVGDLEQTIYEFRGSSAESISALAQRVPATRRLTENFRSTPSICSIVDSLRHSDAVDAPAGRWRESRVPVYVLCPKRFGECGPDLEAILSYAGLTPEDVVCLAHMEWAARECAGAASRVGQTTNRLVGLAEACLAAADRSPTAGRGRASGLDNVQFIMRDLTADAAAKELPDSQFYEKIDLSERQFREGCLRLAVQASAALDKPSGFRSAIKDGIGKFGWGDWIDVGKLRTPKGDRWPGQLRSMPRYRWSTIHGFKGLQSPAVALVLHKPPKSSTEPSGVELWRDGGDGELRRVLYVGASRAEQLLVLVVDSDLRPLVQAVLTRDGVPFTEGLPQATQGI